MRITFILLFAASILCSGCRTASSEYRQADYSPAAWSAWQKCCQIKEGMTYSQVYAILPSTGRFQAGYSPEMESWWLAGNIEEDHVNMTVEYGDDKRVMKIIRGIEHE